MVHLIIDPKTRYLYFIWFYLPHQQGKPNIFNNNKSEVVNEKKIIYIGGFLLVFKS